ncbi:GntR family transcriptional regulator [Pseudoclavibacter helvolus]|uniref:GntR family transcriptional regulator n=1 Tax=Pseudoclavibacter helvolus TaxID=255205 RepID=UPI003C71EDA0
MTIRAAESRKTRVDVVYARILDELMTGEQAPDAVLSITELERRYEVSQTPIREALARLEHTGLVRRHALRGYRVAPLFTDAELLKLMEARLVLEPPMAHEAAQRVTPEFLDELGSTVVDLERVAGAAGSEDPESFRTYWSSDDEFHRLIAKQADNEHLFTAYDSMGAHIQRFRVIASHGYASRASEAAAVEHRRVLDALHARDAEAAATHMRAHIDGARQRLIASR